MASRKIKRVRLRAASVGLVLAAAPMTRGTVMAPTEGGLVASVSVGPPRSTMKPASCQPVPGPVPLEVEGDGHDPLAEQVGRRPEGEGLAVRRDGVAQALGRAEHGPLSGRAGQRVAVGGHAEQLAELLDQARRGHVRGSPEEVAGDRLEGVGPLQQRRLAGRLGPHADGGGHGRRGLGSEVAGAVGPQPGPDLDLHVPAAGDEERAAGRPAERPTPRWWGHRCRRPAPWYRGRFRAGPYR